MEKRLQSKILLIVALFAALVILFELGLTLEYILIFSGAAIVLLLLIVLYFTWNHSRTHIWKCGKCEKIFTIGIWKNLKADSVGIDMKKMKCPGCGEVTVCSAFEKSKLGLKNNFRMDD